MKTFADLKRKLQKGQGVKLINLNGITEQTSPEGLTGAALSSCERAKARLGVVRYVVKVQTNGVYLFADKNATSGSFLPLETASLIEVTDKGFKIFGVGKRELTDIEKQVMANEPRDEKQEEIDMQTDGNVMFYRQKRYYTEAGYKYLLGYEGYVKGLHFDYNSRMIKDKSIKGDLELEYEFVD